VDIDEVARSMGVVCSVTLTFARPVHIDGAIAAVLVVVTFQLARLCRDGLADLADELHRGIVEADDWALGIGRFGVEVEHLFHASHMLAID
jgi:hypothetical protein